MAFCVRRLFCRNTYNGTFIWKKIVRRNFLSEAYNCDVLWKNRLSSPILQKVDVTEFSMKLYEQFERQKMVSTIDMDILANKLEEIDPAHLEFTEDIFYKFRHTQEALKMSPSTQYAFIRAYLDLGQTDRLLPILKDKLNFGIFIDNYTANMLMQHYLDKQDYRSAAQVAYEVMLLDDFGHPTTTLLAWYCCHMNWKNPPPPTEELQTEAAEEQESQDDEDEEDWIRVQWIDNPWWDDHFDLVKDEHLLGKTFVNIGRLHDDILGRSYMFLGYGLWEKFDDGMDLIETCLDDANITEIISQEAVEGFQKVLEETITEELPDLSEKVRGQIHLEDVRPRVTEEMKQQSLERFQNLHSRLKDSGKLVDIQLGEKVKTLVDAVVKLQEDADIDDHKQLFEIWRAERQAQVDKQLKYHADLRKVEEIKETLKELQAKEETLRYFEQQDDISLRLEKADRVELWEKHRQFYDERKARKLERKKVAK